MSPSRNLDLDKLRAVAVVMTMIVHFPRLKAYLPYLDPWSGVDLFFAISGFIVATTFTASMPNSLLNQTSRNAAGQIIYTLAFFCRRFFRLTPAIVAVLLAYFSASYILEGPSFFAEFKPFKEVFAIFTYQYNLFAVATGGGKLIWHWSLSAEEQFYMIFPFFMFLIVRPKHRIIFILSLLALATFVIRPFGLLLFRPGPWLTTADLGVATVLPQYRSDAILYGLLLFSLSRYPWYPLIEIQILKQSRYLAVAVSVILILVLAYAPGLCYSYNATMVTISAVSFLLVWIASYNSNVILPLKLPFFDKILGWIGTRSYGLYLLNVPTNLTMKTAFARLSDHGLDLPYQISFPITLATFLISAEFLYRFIEQPFLKMGGRYAKKIMGLINSPKLETTPS